MQLWTFLQYGRAFTFRVVSVMWRCCRASTSLSLPRKTEPSDRVVVCFIKIESVFFSFLSFVFFFNQNALSLSCSLVWAHRTMCACVCMCVECGECVTQMRAWPESASVFVPSGLGATPWHLPAADEWHGHLSSYTTQSQKNQEKNGWGGGKKGKALCNAE